MRFNFSLVALCISVLCLCACDHHGGEPVRLNSYAHLTAQDVDVLSYEIVPLASDEEHGKSDTFFFSPDDAIERFFRHRFKAAGDRGVLRVLIQSVSVDHRVVASDHVVNKTLDIGKKDHYLIRARIRVEADNTIRGENKQITFNAQRNVYVSEHSSIDEKERLQAKAIDALIDDLDHAVTKTLEDRFFLL